MRKILAFSRHYLAERGLAVRPQTHRTTGQYSGFSMTWGGEQEGVVRGAAVLVSHERGEAIFFVENERDFIQRMHLHGRFYELDELEMIAAHANDGTYLDIGANVGNHAVFAGLFLPFKRILAVEPNPRPRRLLELNLRLNGLFAQSTILPVGFSDQEGEASIVVPLVNNIGAAHISDDASSGVRVNIVKGDDALGEEPLGFVKMDIEGHELRALRGMRGVLERDKPTLLLEVHRKNDISVGDLMAQLGYRLEHRLDFAEKISNQLFVAA
ncbi:MAG: FkbM family methyltransferase [Erythrobacter sp.]|uniref:FkbM family methyltransferase n=1 Tax=Erythrobacter sp. TaxID=1042 RepID=UPI002616E315|nr:FkbM family methyltransferase [Erythrobacter sp.]MDJ0979836.1 FkbM family methyltransferase [Erythrobacter sp.]